MTIINKTKSLVQLGLVVFGLAVGLSAYAEIPYEVIQNCTSCHDGLTVTSAAGSVVIGGGVRPAPQRSFADWVNTVNRMNDKGCGVPAGAVTSIANYLASLVPETTTCYKADNTTVTVQGTHFCPGGTSNAAAPTCSTSYMMLNENQKWKCITAPPTAPVICAGTTGSTNYYYYAAGNGFCN